MGSPTPMFDKFREECGVFGIFGHPEASKLTYLGLYALQHRGQESAGIAACDGGQIRVSKAMGHVNDAFNDDVLAKLPGEIAVGHVRYSTAGESRLANAQPLVVDSMHGPARGLPQRQPDQRRRTARRARQGRRDLPVHVRYRSRRPPLRALAGGQCRSGSDRRDLAGARARSRSS